MAGRPSILKVDIIADAKGAGKGVAEAEGKFSKLGKTLGKVGKLAAFGLAGGLAAAGAAAFKLAQGAAEDEQGQARLAKALHNTAGATRGQVAAVEDWITAQGKALGVADDDLRPALGRLSAATHDVGKAQKLTSLAMDISAGSGKSLEAVSTALAKAQTGNVGGLSRLGVATKDAAGQTRSLKDITADLATTYKGQAATAANTTAGKFGRLKLQLSEMGETIGGKLLPIGNKLAGWALNKMGPAAGKLGGQLATKLGPAFRAVSGFITTKVVPAARAFIGWYQDKIVPAIKRTVAPVLDGLRVVFGKVSDAISRNREPLAKIGNLLKTLAEFIVTKVAPVVGKVLGLAFKGLGIVLGGVIDVIGKLVGWIDTAIGKIQDLAGWIGKIHMPDLGKLNPFSAPLHTIGYQLVGDAPSYDRRGGWSTAAASSGTSWSLLQRSAGTLAAGGVVIDARVQVDVDNRASLTDEAALARKLQRILRDHGARIGQLASYATVTP